MTRTVTCNWIFVSMRECTAPRLSIVKLYLVTLSARSILPNVGSSLRLICASSGTEWFVVVQCIFANVIIIFEQHKKKAKQSIEGKKINRIRSQEYVASSVFASVCRCWYREYSENTDLIRRRNSFNLFWIIWKWCCLARWEEGNSGGTVVEVLLLTKPHTSQSTANKSSTLVYWCKSHCCCCRWPYMRKKDR